jgi:predicted transcriptional regulator
MPKQWSSIGLPKELIKEIYEISDAEDRTREAVVRRAINLYAQRPGREAEAALK